MTVGLEPRDLLDQPVGERFVEGRVAVRGDVVGYRRDRLGEPLLGLMAEQLAS